MPTSFWQGFMGALLALVVAASLALGTVTLVAQGHASQVACAQVNGLRAALVTVLQNSESAAPSNTYFKQHPDQLAEAQREYRYDLSKLGPIHC